MARKDTIDMTPSKRPDRYHGKVQGVRFRQGYFFPLQTSVYHFFVFFYGPNIFKIAAQARLERLIFKHKTNDNIFRRVFVLRTDSSNAFISKKVPLSALDQEK